ncbi:chemotaxis protein CheW [Fundidesulfovibrio agrisoli]|uniref:chemotaxis protein CheW n=1 Tax=Fundidesulfovibrio agrisoli TaxID=2922717 RepID=UPI001FAB8A61|nr:chemotaxis protein CheW [Fundidesulfovibrio agrisoli]
MKTLENYFAQDVNLPEAPGGMPGLTNSEKAFLEKYVGAGWEGSEAAGQLSRPVEPERVLMPAGQSPIQAAPQEQPALQPGEDLEAGLMAEPELRLVSFHVAGQLFAVPIMLVQEVLRAVPATKLPAAPAFLAGVTNLRGRVTPLVDLSVLLDIERKDQEPDNFLIVCRIGDMQIGMLVRAIDTMYKAPREDIEWGIEAKVGVNADLMAGLLKAQERLIKILSVSRLFQKVLKS